MAMPALLIYIEACWFLRWVTGLLSTSMAAVKAVVSSGKSKAYVLFWCLWESSTIAGFFLMWTEVERVELFANLKKAS